MIGRPTRAKRPPLAGERRRQGFTEKLFDSLNDIPRFSKRLRYDLILLPLD